MEPTSFWGYLIGTANYALYGAEWVFALMGAFLSLRLHAYSRDAMSDGTPGLFSWKFLLADNIWRIVTALVLIFIFLRFPGQLLLAKLDGASEVWRLLTALGVGFLNDKLAQVLKSFNFMGIGNSNARKTFSYDSASDNQSAASHRK